MKNKKPDKYHYLLARDFCLGTIEVNSIEGDFSLKPWAKEKCPFFPYCLFWRKDKMVIYVYSKKGEEWIKSQINKIHYKDPEYYKTIVDNFEKSIKPVKGILDKKKTLSLKELECFCKIIEKAWPWFEAHWWNVDLFEEQGKTEKLDFVLKARQKYVDFVPKIDIVIKKSLRKAYPSFEKYIDVISLREAFSGKIPNKAKLEKRLKGYFYVDYKLYTGVKKSFFEKKFNILIEEDVAEKDIKEIKGRIAFPGKVRGKVCKIFLAKELGKMKKGDVLVSPTTLPDLMPAIKKASAIVADEGGLLSHAAIVSRELKTPCIIGTKIATKVLKDGDEVEVDADKGIVRILK